MAAGALVGALWVSACGGGAPIVPGSPAADAANAAAGAGGAPTLSGSAGVNAAAATGSSGGSSGVDAARETGGPLDSPSGPDRAAPDAPTDAAPEALPSFACNLDCPGGPCPMRSAQPTVVFAGPATEHIAALATTPDALYVGTIADDIFVRGQLVKLRLSTSGSSQIARNVQVSDIRIGPDGVVYFIVEEVQSEARELWSVSGPAPPSVIATADEGLGGFVPGAGSYWEEELYPGGFIIWSVVGGGIDRLAEGTQPAHGLAVGDSLVFWASGAGPSSISDLPADGSGTGDGVLLTSATDVLANPTLDGTNLYFIHQHAPGDCQGALMVIPAAGGTPTAVSTGASGADISSFVVGEDFVYWATPDAGGVVFRAAKRSAGVGPEIIATGQASVAALAVDATRVYWVAAGAGGDEVRALAQ